MLSTSMKKCTFVFVMLASALIPLTAAAVAVDYSVETTDLYAQILERDVDEPSIPLNGSATTITTPPEVSIDIDPLEPLPVNGTVTISMDGAVDTNMNDIPPEGVTVIVTNTDVTVTSHPVTIEEGAQTSVPPPTEATEDSDSDSDE